MFCWGARAVGLQCFQVLWTQVAWRLLTFPLNRLGAFGCRSSRDGKEIRKALKWFTFLFKNAFPAPASVDYDSEICLRLRLWLFLKAYGSDLGLPRLRIMIYRYNKRADKDWTERDNKRADKDWTEREYLNAPHVQGPCFWSSTVNFTFWQVKRRL